MNHKNSIHFIDGQQQKQNIFAQFIQQLLILNQFIK
jgi:hypothetical protein